MSRLEFGPEDLLPMGDRVSPDAIRDGLMEEHTVIYQGQVRHLPRITHKGARHFARELFGLDPDDVFPTKEGMS